MRLIKIILFRILIEPHPGSSNSTRTVSKDPYKSDEQLETITDRREEVAQNTYTISGPIKTQAIMHVSKLVRDMVSESDGTNM